MTTKKESTKKADAVSTPSTPKAKVNEKVINIKPKTPTYECLQFEGIEQIAEVIDFLGELPAIQKDLSLKVRKYDIKKGSYMLKSEGKLVKVETELSNYNQVVKK